MAKAINKLKCGGKVQKMDKGGSVESDKFINLKDLTPDQINALSSAGFNLASDISGAIFDARANQISEGYTADQNPGEVLSQLNKVNNRKDLVSMALKGAGAGAAVGGPLGAVAGGAIGLITAGIKSKLGEASNEAEALKATQNWSARSARASQVGGYKRGGLITGKGGPKSDDIKMKADPGAFVVPAENAEQAMKYGRKYLGWTDNSIAARSQGATNIRVSDGEVYFTPEEVSALSYYDVDLNKLAPNAKTQKEMGKYQTGMTDNNAVSKSLSTIASNSPTLNLQSGANNAISKQAPQLTTKKEEEKKEEEKKFDLADNIPEIVGFAQTLGGLAGLITAKKKPDLEVSRTLRQLSSEVRKRAESGLDPVIKNNVLNQIERSRRDYENSISAKGGSAQDVLASRLKGLTTTLGAKANLAYTDAQEKVKKWADVMKVDMAKAGQEFDINKINLADYYKTQEMYADVLTSGVSNVIGARQLKSEQENLRKIAESGRLNFS